MQVSSFPTHCMQGFIRFIISALYTQCTPSCLRPAPCRGSFLLPLFLLREGSLSSQRAGLPLYSPPSTQRFIIAPISFSLSLSLSPPLSLSVSLSAPCRVYFLLSLSLLHAGPPLYSPLHYSTSVSLSLLHAGLRLPCLYLTLCRASFVLSPHPFSPQKEGGSRVRPVIKCNCRIRGEVKLSLRSRHTPLQG